MIWYDLAYRIDKDWLDFCLPWHLISVKVWGRNATIGGVELAPKYTAHFKKGVNIKVENESVVDVFYVVEKPKKHATK